MHGPDPDHVLRVDVLVEGLLYQVLRLETGQNRHLYRDFANENCIAISFVLPHLLIQEYQPQVQACPEHEDVREHLDLGDGARREGVGHGNEAHVGVGRGLESGGCGIASS